MALSAPPANLPPSQTVVLPDGASTQVRTSGLGDDPDHLPLVLIHGWWVTADLNWGYNLAGLGAHHPVVTVDLPGHGHGPRRKSRFSMRACADDIVAVLDRLGIERCIAVGYSLGGAVAQRLAHRHPQRVVAAVFCATTNNFAVQPVDRVRMGLLPGVAALARPLPRPTLRKAFDWGLAGRMHYSVLGPWATAEVGQGDLATVLDAGAALSRFDSTRWVGRIEGPVASVITTRDRTVPPAGQRRLARLADASVHEVAGNHAVCITDPPRFNAALLRAVADVSTLVDRTSFGGVWADR